METNIWITVITGIVSLLTGGGLWAWIKAREDKRKTPYDMFRDLLAEQKKVLRRTERGLRTGKVGFGGKIVGHYAIAFL